MSVLSQMGKDNFFCMKCLQCAQRIYTTLIFLSLQNVSNLEMKVEVLYECGGGNVPGGVVLCGMGVVDEMGRTPVVCFNEKKWELGVCSEANNVTVVQLLWR